MDPGRAHRESAPILVNPDGERFVSMSRIPQTFAPHRLGHRLGPPGCRR
jgi:hypothetical protein